MKNIHLDITKKHGKMLVQENIAGILTKSVKVKLTDFTMQFVNLKM